MFLKPNNYAFIDGNNLYLGLSEDIINQKNNQKVYSGWKLDYKRFRVYLHDKYGVAKAFLFIGFKPGNEAMYTQMQEWGYICVFKPTLQLSDGRVKGNVDAELVLHSMIEWLNYNKAIIVSGDGDFYCLAEYLMSQDKLEKILVPNQLRYSSLLDKLSTPENDVLSFLGALKDKLEYKNFSHEKGSRRDKTLREPFSS
ncbi:NYN domain-containing protein [Candidatus Falkowbacteria bacterium]|nr:NYN domain-containing protein [Candidatus Falkowbacteria bacterium]